MKYTEERYIKKDCDQKLERLSITSFFSGLMIMIIGMIVQLLDFDLIFGFKPDTLGLIIVLFGLVVIALGFILLINSCVTLERNYKVIDTEEEE